MPTDSFAGVSKWLLDRWASHLADALSGMMGEKVEVRPDDRPVTPEGLLWAQELAGFEGPDWFVTAPAPAWQRLGGRILELAGLSETTPDDQRGTFLEVLSQSLSSLAQETGPKLGRELTLGAGSEPPEPPPGLAWMGVRVEMASGGEPAVLAVAFSESFMARLAPPKETAIAAAVGASAPSGPAPAPSAPARTFDLLMDVELPVSVSFGRNQMTLKELVKLNTGAIVELNRSVMEPVEVIVNNCVIARGEVVVVEGNYGVRVRQIISREERLRTLF